MFKCDRPSRREFLKMAGIAASAAVLGACILPRTPDDPPEIEPTATTTPTPPQPTPTSIPSTPTPTILIEAGGFEVVLVEAGSFDMGSTEGFSREQPVHAVTITRPFYVSRHEVTLEQYDEFCDASGRPRPDDSGWGRGNRPVGVSWYDAVEYCNWLTEREGLTPCYSGGGLATECNFSANGYRLPTEAEWEYAARGGQRSRGYMYAGSNNPDDVAWYQHNSDDQTHPVGQKKPNELGLCDMSGNSGEWCWDWYERHYYELSPSRDPTGPDLPTGHWNQSRVRRGGDYWNSADSLRVTARSLDTPVTQRPEHGFRIVRPAT